LEKKCVICGKPIEDETQIVKCIVCGAVMHKSCSSDEALLDAEENNLCPYDAMLAALDWFDAVVSTYATTLTSEQKNDIVARLKSYIGLLEG
jgi:hypothetical protein